MHFLCNLQFSNYHIIIKLVRSGTFACYGDMTVTMDKSGSNAEGPIDGKKGTQIIPPQLLPYQRA